jgi:RNA polymerase sigma-70 factor (ECF subfamily)
MPTGDRVWRERGLRSAVLAGDDSAWRAWYEETFPGLYAFVRWRSGGLGDLTDEVMQETWLTAVRRIRRFNPEQGSFADWLRGIAVKILSNLLRKRKRQAVQSLNGQLLAAKETPDAAVAKDQAEQIAQALANLPERYEAALRAKYLDQQSVNQIAEAWHETPKAIESLLTRARQALREAFQGRELG